MPNNSPGEGVPPSQVKLLYTSEFKRSLRRLAKKYRRIRSDLQPVLDRLLAHETPGDRVPGTGAVVYKVRVRNSDAQRGTSGGYRMIYYLKTADTVVLLTLYSKSEQGDISPAQIRQILQGFESQSR